MEIKHIGVVGLGRTGQCVLERVQAIGYTVTAYDADPVKVAAAAAAGAWPARIPADAAETADVVVVTMPDEGCAHEALLDLGGIGETLREGAYVLDASAVSPQFSLEATTRLAAFGIVRIELSVDGRPASSEAGLRRVFVGGAPHEVAVMAPLLIMLADHVVHVGPVGSIRRTRRACATAKHRASAADHLHQPALAPAR